MYKNTGLNFLKDDNNKYINFIWPKKDYIFNMFLSIRKFILSLFYSYVESIIKNKYIPNDIVLYRYEFDYKSNTILELNIENTIFYKGDTVYQIVIRKGINYYYFNNTLLLPSNTIIEFLGNEVKEEEYSKDNFFKTYIIKNFEIEEPLFLTKNQLLTIGHYTFGFYRKINYELRNNDITDKTVLKQIYNLDNAFKKAPITKNILHLYRGNKKLNLTNNNAYLSTSLNKHIALNFIGDKCCLYEIFVDVGIPYLYVKNYSSVRKEDEVLLPRNLIYEILTETQDENGITTYNIQVKDFIQPNPIEVYTYNEVLDFTYEEFVENFDYLTFNQKYQYLYPIDIEYKYANPQTQILTFDTYTTNYHLLTNYFKYYYYIYYLTPQLLEQYPTFKDFDEFIK